MKRLFFVLLLSTIALNMTAQNSVPKYNIKSGTVKSVTEVMGQIIKAVSFFDNFGALEVTKTETNGKEVITVYRDGKTYLVNASTQQVQEMPTRESINYLNLTDELVEKYNIQIVGKDVVAGKECIKYTMKVSQLGETAIINVSVWEGYPMKTTTTTMGMSVAIIVTEIEEGDIDPFLFELPSF